MSSTDYTTLQNTLDKVLGKIGLENTVVYLQNLLSNTSIKQSQTEKLRLITTYVIDKAIAVFDLDEKNFYVSKIPEYREARMACFHILKEYTGSSYSRIGERFDLSKRQVMYNYQRCDERLSIPQFYKIFVAKYRDLENQTINFLSKL